MIFTLLYRLPALRSAGQYPRQNRRTLGELLLRMDLRAVSSVCSASPNPPRGLGALDNVRYLQWEPSSERSIMLTTQSGCPNLSQTHAVPCGSLLHPSVVLRYRPSFDPPFSCCCPKTCSRPSSPFKITLAGFLEPSGAPECLDRSGRVGKSFTKGVKPNPAHTRCDSFSEARQTKFNLSIVRPFDLAAFRPSLTRALPVHTGAHGCDQG